jgi:MoaA/NifB/PqqE/SkfB family radical SAM enzyme
LAEITDKVIPNLIRSNVTKVTLTGGEPLVHKNVLNIVSALCHNNIAISICTNGSLITDSFLNSISAYTNVHFNISLDGLEFKSHGRFRGNLDYATYSRIIENIKKVGNLNLLNGILTTPNKFAKINEYNELCKFAREVGAKYILMNPLSPFGRGQETQSLAYYRDEMINLKNRTIHNNDDTFEVVYIRFPNEKGLPLGGCPIGSFPYIFTNGDVTICPYMTFASKNDDNRYNSDQFILYNIFTDDITIQESIEKYTLPYGLEINPETFTGKGCCASKIANNQPLVDFDDLT